MGSRPSYYFVREGGSSEYGCDWSGRRDSTEQEVLLQVCTPSLGSSHCVRAT